MKSVFFSFQKCHFAVRTFSFEILSAALMVQRCAYLVALLKTVEHFSNERLLLFLAGIKFLKR